MQGVPQGAPFMFMEGEVAVEENTQVFSRGG
jgi:hypothetical protein